MLLRLLCGSVQKPRRSQHSIWEKGCLSSSSALGLCLASTKMLRMKSRAWSDVCEGRSGLVGWVAILNIAAMASYSAHGGFSVSISTTVQPRLLQKTYTINGVSKQVETNTTFFLCDSLLKPYRNVFGGNFDTHCLQMASATYLGALLSFQHKLKTWNIPTSVMTCLTGLQPITSLAWWVTTQLDCMRECGLLCVGV